MHFVKIEKPSFRSERRAWGLMKARPSTAYVQRVTTLSPRPVGEREHPVALLSDVFKEVLVLLSQFSQGCSRLYFFSNSPYSSSF